MSDQRTFDYRRDDSPGDAGIAFHRWSAAAPTVWRVCDCHERGPSGPFLARVVPELPLLDPHDARAAPFTGRGKATNDTVFDRDAQQDASASDVGVCCMGNPLVNEGARNEGARECACGTRGRPVAAQEELIRSRQIFAAAHAAPNPLSMFTTVTPAAQLLSMASRAAIPPKLAP